MSLQASVPQDAAAALEPVLRVAAENAARTDADARFPRETVDALGAAGLLGLTVDAAHGGMGLGPVAVAQLLPRLAEVDASAAMVYMMHLSGVACLNAAPAGDLRDEALEQAAKGKHLTTLAFSERGSRSHFWAPVSRARVDGDGVLLSADKSFVTSAGEADTYVVTTLSHAGTGPTDSTLYLVDADADGVAVEAPWNGLGLRGNASSPVTLRDVRVGDERRLTAECGGFDAKVGVVLPTFNLASACVSLGVCRAATAATGAHLQSARFEHMDMSLGEALPTLRAGLARMGVRTDQLADTVERTAASLENPDDMTQLRVLEVKAAGNEAALDVTATAMRACGGAAYAKGVAVERNFRDAQAGAVMAPTADVLYDLLGKARLGLPLF